MSILILCTVSTSCKITELFFLTDGTLYGINHLLPRVQVLPQYKQSALSSQSASKLTDFLCSETFCYSFGMQKVVTTTLLWDIVSVGLYVILPASFLFPQLLFCKSCVSQLMLLLCCFPFPLPYFGKTNFCLSRAKFNLKNEINHFPFFSALPEASKIKKNANFCIGWERATSSGWSLWVVWSGSCLNWSC